MSSIRQNARTLRQAAIAALVPGTSPPHWLERAVHHVALLVRDARRMHRLAPPRQEFLADAERLVSALLLAAERLQAAEQRWEPALAVWWPSAGDELPERLRQMAERLQALQRRLAGSGSYDMPHALGLPEPQTLCAVAVVELHQRLHGQRPDPKRPVIWTACESLWRAAGGVAEDGLDPLGRWRHFVEVARGRAGGEAGVLLARRLIADVVEARKRQLKLPKKGSLSRVDKPNVVVTMDPVTRLRGPR